MRRFNPAIVCVLLSLACSDTPVRPELEANQGSGGSTAPFAFLPPLGPPVVPTGPFNPRLAPVVEVCAVTAGACGPVIARMSLVEGGANKIIVNEPYERYQTKFATLTAGVFRIRVLTGNSDDPSSTLFGEVDATMAAGSGIPIYFRIEEGALCDPAECFEGKVTNEGGVLTLDDSTAGVSFPPGSLPPGQGPVNVIVERVTGGDACLPTNHPQYEGCYHIRTEPDVDLEVEAVIGVCLETAGRPFINELQLWKWDEVNESSVQALPKKIVDFLDCDPEVSAAHGVRGFLAGLTRPLLSIISPDPLHAGKVPVPFGGGLSDFSRVGWVRPLAVQKVVGDNQTGVTGSLANYAPTVRVVSAINGAIARGIPVTFTPQSGSSASPLNMLTDGYGLARTDWTLGSSTGPQAMLADVSNPRPFWPGRPGVAAATSFSATAAAPSPPAFSTAFFAPLGTLTIGPLGWRSDLAPVVVICRLAGLSCVEEVVTLTGFTIETAKRAYLKYWAVPATLRIGEYYRFRVMVGGVPISTATARSRAKTATGDAGEPVFNVGKSMTVRFTLY